MLQSTEPGRSENSNQTLKKGKSPEVDGVTREMLKTAVNVPASILTEIFSQIWVEDQIPEAWKTGPIFTSPK
jgi:hypothetical protein